MQLLENRQAMLLSRNQQKLLQDQNGQLRFLLQQKDELLEELTCKLVDYQHSDLARQQQSSKLLGQARDQVRKVRKDGTRKRKKRSSAESLSWFRTALSEQVCRIRQHFDGSLKVLERKQEEDLRELESKYELLVKVKQEELDAVGLQLKQKIAAGQKRESIIESNELKWKQKEAEYQQLMRRSEKGIRKLENQVGFLKKQRDRLLNQLEQANGLLTETKQSHGANRQQLEEQVEHLKHELTSVRRHCEDQLAEARQAYKSLEDNCLQRERNVQRLVRNSSRQRQIKPPQPIKCEIAQLSEHFQKLIEELTVSNSLKDKQIEILKQKIANYRKQIRLEDSSDKRLDDVELTGNAVKSLYQGFKKDLKAKLPRS